MKKLFSGLCLSAFLLPFASINAAEIDTVTDLRLL